MQKRVRARVHGVSGLHILVMLLSSFARAHFLHPELSSKKLSMIGGVAEIEGG